MAEAIVHALERFFRQIDKQGSQSVDDAKLVLTSGLGEKSASIDLLWDIHQLSMWCMYIRWLCDIGPRSRTWTGDTLMSAETFLLQLQSGALPTELSEVFLAKSLPYLILINDLTNR